METNLINVHMYKDENVLKMNWKVNNQILWNSEKTDIWSIIIDNES